MRVAIWLVFCTLCATATLSAEVLDVPGARLYYSDAGGENTPVVLLHAASGSSRNWIHQQDAFRAAGYRIIAYDRRGWGRTELNTEANTVPAADDLLALADHLKLGRFHLLGVAAGGIVALEFALAYPERLRSLVVANSIGGMKDEALTALGKRLRPSPQFEALPPEFRELGPAYRAANPEGTQRWIELEKASKTAGARTTQVPRMPLTFAALERLKVPSLILSGGADLYSPPALMKMFADRIPGAVFVNLPDAGHSAYWEQPEAFNERVLAFFARNDKRR